ncbi:MAG: BlaI/MecI/CopY family transcriptional regulator [Longimicrobiales bacterium]
MKDLERLTELQLAILDVLWERGEASAREVWEALEPSTGLARKTIGTLLTRLQVQRVIGHRKVGREFVFRPRVTREDVREAKVRDVLDAAFAGDVTALVSQALTTGDVAPGDVRRLRSVIERWAKEQAG